MIDLMRKTLAALFAVCALAGCQPESPAPEPTAPPAVPETSAPSTDAAEPTLAPGSFGPISVGMSKDDAIATGLVEEGTEAPVEGCPPPALLWKAPYDDQLDVQVDMEDNVASIGTLKDSTVKTSEGVGIGSTLADLQEAYPNASDPKELGYGQSGVIVTDGAKHLGFLFDPPVADLTDSDTVTFVEATEGEEPSLMRDGC